jgi:hypothetical protein
MSQPIEIDVAGQLKMMSQINRNQFFFFFACANHEDALWLVICDSNRIV